MRKLFIYIYKRRKTLLKDGPTVFILRFSLKFLLLTQKYIIRPGILKLSSLIPENIELKSNTFSIENLLIYRPLISVILHKKNKSSTTLESIKKQSYRNYELIIIDQETFSPSIYNTTLEKIKGEFLVFLDSNDILDPDAFIQFVRFIQSKHHEVDLCYTDEVIKPSDKKRDRIPFYKPDFNKLLLLSFDFLGHFVFIRTSLIRSIGWTDEKHQENFYYDLILRLIERTEKIIHLSITLNTRIKENETTLPKEKKVLEGYFKRNNIKAQIINNSSGFRVEYSLEIHPQIAIIIPFKDKLDYLVRATKSILEKTTYSNFKIYLINNNSQTEEMLSFLKQTKLNVINYNNHYNFSLLHNEIVSKLEEEYLLFLNNDIEIITNNWCECLLEYIQQKDVAAVGGLLLYPNNLIQHAGIVTTTNCEMFAFNLSQTSSPIYQYELNFPQYVNGVTAACMLIKKSIFQKIGGFDPIHFPIGYSDVDLCLRIIEAGYKIVYTPYARLFHHEGGSRNMNKENYEEFLLGRKYLRNRSIIYDRYRTRHSFYSKNI